MNTRQRMGMGEEEMSPHLRQRVAFMAALIPGAECANWAAISDTWDDLSRETKGTAFEQKVQALRHPIEIQDARRLAQTIGVLLKGGS